MFRSDDGAELEPLYFEISPEAWVLWESGRYREVLPRSVAKTFEVVMRKAERDIRSKLARNNLRLVK